MMPPPRLKKAHQSNYFLAINFNNFTPIQNFSMRIFCLLFFTNIFGFAMENDTLPTKSLIRRDFHFQSTASSHQPKKLEAGCVMRDICGADGDLRQNCRFGRIFIFFKNSIILIYLSRFN